MTNNIILKVENNSEVQKYENLDGVGGIFVKKMPKSGLNTALTV